MIEIETHELMTVTGGQLHEPGCHETVLNRWEIRRNRLDDVGDAEVGRERFRSLAACHVLNDRL